MSFWKDALRAVQQAALLQYKVDQAMSVAEEARRHSLETRERVLQIEAFLNHLRQKALEQRAFEQRTTQA